MTNKHVKANESWQRSRTNYDVTGLVVDFYVVKRKKIASIFDVKVFVSLLLCFEAFSWFISCSGTKIPAFMSQNFTKSATSIVKSSQFWCSMLFSASVSSKLGLEVCRVCVLTHLSVIIRPSLNRFLCWPKHER